MQISFALFGREFFSISVLKDDDLIQLALGSILERSEDEEESEELAFGFSPPPA